MPPPDLSREQRGLGRLKLAHGSPCDSGTTFKVMVTRLLYSLRVYASGSCSGDRRNVLSVKTYCYIAVCRRGARSFGAQRAERGGGISWRLPAYSLFITLLHCSRKCERVHFCSVKTCTAKHVLQFYAHQ